MGGGKRVHRRRFRAPGLAVRRPGVSAASEEGSSHQAEEESPRKGLGDNAGFCPRSLARGPQRAIPAGRPCSVPGLGVPLPAAPRRGEAGGGSRAGRGRGRARRGHGQSSLEVWQEGHKSPAARRALRKSDCDLFGLVTIQVGETAIYPMRGFDKWAGRDERGQSL